MSRDKELCLPATTAGAKTPRNESPEDHVSRRTNAHFAALRTTGRSWRAHQEAATCATIVVACSLRLQYSTIVDSRHHTPPNFLESVGITGRSGSPQTTSLNRSTAHAPSTRCAQESFMPKQRDCPSRSIWKVVLRLRQNRDIYRRVLSNGYGTLMVELVEFINSYDLWHDSKYHDS